MGPIYMFFIEGCGNMIPRVCCGHSHRRIYWYVASPLAGLNLDYITDNPWTVLSISAKRGDGVDQAVDFLLRHSK